MRFFNRLTLVSIFIFAGFIPLSALSSPVIGISSMYDIISPGEQSLTKRIYNTGDSTAFVRVEILEIDPDRKKENAEIPQKELSGKALEQNRLLVTPQRLIISPGGFSVVRILWVGERDRERYFRIRFSPVLPEADDSFGLDKEAITDYREKALHAGLNVLAGYGSITIIQPDKPSFKTDINDSAAEGISVHNHGNATIALDNIRQCKSARTDCSVATREIILPGRSYLAKKKDGYQTSFTLVEGNNSREIR